MILATFLAGSLAALPLLAQEVSGATQESVSPFPVVQRERLVLEQYQPQHVRADELFRVASQTVGRRVLVRDETGVSGVAVGTLNRLGERILVYDEPAEATRVLGVLRQMDVEPQEATTETLAHAPRHVSLQSLQDALRRHFDQSVQVAAVADGNTLLVRGTPAQVAEARAVIEEVDVAPPEVLLEVRLLVVPDERHEGQGSAPPAELAEDLGRLLPEMTFRQGALSMLRTTIVPDRPVELRLDPSMDALHHHRLELWPSSFDAEGGEIGLDRLELSRVVPGEPSLVFRTSATLRLGEHTVVGLSGDAPTLLVVRALPVR